MQRVDPGQLRHAARERQRPHRIHPPQDQLAVDGAGVLRDSAGRGPAPAGRGGQRGGCPQGVVVRGGQQQRQQRVAGQIVEVEAMTAVP